MNVERRRFLLEGPLSLVLLGALLATAVGCQGGVKNAEAAPAEQAMKVESVPVAERSVPRVLRLSGNLEADRSSDVAADASGKVRATFIERGAFVKKGAVLAILDASSAAIAAGQAKADADAARTDADLRDTELARTKRLHSMKAIADAELDRAQAERDAARQRVDSMNARVAREAKSVGDATIRAPFDGVITERFVDVGEYVRPDTKVATLVSANILRLRLSVPESAASEVHMDQAVEFKVGSDPAVHTAKVRFVGAEVRQASRDLIVEAIVDNADHSLRPGMFTTARIAIGEEKGLLIPNAAVRKEGVTRRVFVLRSGRLEERLVQLGEAIGEETVVVSGLDAGERIASPAGTNLRDGLRAE